MSENPEASITQAQRQAYLDRYGLTPAEAGHEMLLQMIEDHFAEGLETKVEPFPETDREFGALLDELRPLSADQLREFMGLAAQSAAAQANALPPYPDYLAAMCAAPARTTA